MDEAKRLRLAERRRLNALRLQRRAISKAFETVALPLCNAGVRFSKLMPKAFDEILGSLTAGPGQDEELDFAWMGNAVQNYWAGDRFQRDELTRRALRACSEPDAHVAVIWSPFKAGLKVRATDLAEHVGLVLDADRDTTWIVGAKPSRWLLQVGYWTETVAYSLAVPQRAG